MIKLDINDVTIENMRIEHIPQIMEICTTELGESAYSYDEFLLAVHAPDKYI